MKSFKKKTIIIVTLLFVSLISSNFLNVSNENFGNKKQKNTTTKDEPAKTSYTWVYPSFVIDDLGGGDYTWAEIVSRP